MYVHYPTRTGRHQPASPIATTTAPWRTPRLLRRPSANPPRTIAGDIDKKIRFLLLPNADRWLTEVVALGPLSRTRRRRALERLTECCRLFNDRSCYTNWILDRSQHARARTHTHVSIARNIIKSVFAFIQIVCGEISSSRPARYLF